MNREGKIGFFTFSDAADFGQKNPLYSARGQYSGRISFSQLR